MLAVTDALLNRCRLRGARLRASINACAQLVHHRHLMVRECEAGYISRHLASARRRSAPIAWRAENDAATTRVGA